MPCFYGKLHAIILYSTERVFMSYITNTFRCLLWYSVFLSLSQPILCIPWEIMSSTGISVYITKTAFHSLCKVCVCVINVGQINPNVIDKTKQRNSKKNSFTRLHCNIFIYTYIVYIQFMFWVSIFCRLTQQARLNSIFAEIFYQEDYN